MQCLPRIDFSIGGMSLNCDQLSQMFIFVFILIVHFENVILLLQIFYCVTGYVADSGGKKDAGKRFFFQGFQLLLEKRMVLMVVNDKNKHHPR
jgi:hypothetical protein